MNTKELIEETMELLEKANHAPWEFWHDISNAAFQKLTKPPKSNLRGCTK